MRARPTVRSRFTVRSRLGALVAAAAAVLAGCTGVPTSSAPAVVGTITANAPQVAPVPTPAPGTFPRTIVVNFLQANAANDEHHAAARQYLTPEERTRWSDTAGTTIFDSVKPGSFDPKTNTVTLTGSVVGTLDQNGVYKPNTQGDGTSTHGATQTLTVGLKQVSDQWRISSLSYPGLLLSQSQFSQYYAPWAVYFYDQSEQRLVPSLHYSPLTDPTALATWLLNQLAAGPSASATTASLGTDLPSIPSGAQLKIAMGDPIAVDLPGASQLDPQTRDRMAAQVALTLAQAEPNVPIEITDGSRPVVIPAVNTTSFTAADFDAQIPAPSADPSLYFVYHGGVSGPDGNPLRGAIGADTYNLSSVALARIKGTRELRVAGTSGSGNKARLLLGQTGEGLYSTALRGALSRPDWVPGLTEVWVGDGASLYRVGLDGVAHAVPITAATGTIAGRIMAVRLSPEGARVALVIAASGGSSQQIWVGTVVRTPDSVQVTAALPVSPVGITVTDVAWADQRKLYAVGYARVSKDPGVYTVECDGSSWSASGIGALPGPADSVTVAQGVFPPEPAVSAGSGGDTIWVQSEGGWTSPAKGYTYGTNPFFVN